MPSNSTEPTGEIPAEQPRPARVVGGTVPATRASDQRRADQEAQKRYMDERFGHNRALYRNPRG
jgi:hypothetical protein